MRAGKSDIVDRDFVLMFASNLLSGFSFYVLLTCMAQYAIDVYGAAPALAGFAASVFVLGEMSGRILTGWLVGRTTEARIALMALAVFAAFSLLYFVEAGIGLLVFVRFAQGIGFGASTTVMQGIALAGLPSARYAEGASVFSLSVTVGTALGPLIGLVLTHNVPYRLLFGLSAGLAFLALLAFVPVRRGKGMVARRAEGTLGTSAAPMPTRAPSASQAAGTAPPLARPFRAAAKKARRLFPNRRTLLFAPIVFGMGLAFYSVTTFVNGFGLQEGFGDFTAYLFGAYFIGLVVFRPIAGKVMDRRGPHAVLLVAFAAFFLMFLVLACVGQAAVLLVVGLLLALGFGVLLSSGLALCSAAAPAEDKTRIVAAYYVCFNLGCVLGAYLSGFMVDGVGYRLMYALWAAATLLLPFYYGLVRKRLNEDRP